MRREEGKREFNKGGGDRRGKSWREKFRQRFYFSVGYKCQTRTQSYDDSRILEILNQPLAHNSTKLKHLIQFYWLANFDTSRYSLVN